MQVNGKQVDMLQWLRQTGGSNAVSRFSTTQSPAKTEPQAKTPLSKDETALLKSQLQLNKAMVATGMTADSVSTYISQLKALQPTLPAQASADTNRVDFSNKKTNSASVNGKNNIIDFTSGAAPAQYNTVQVTGNSNEVRGYTGGQQNNSVTLTGTENRVYAGKSVSGGAVSVKGSNNTVSLGETASDNSVSITGNNVEVSVGSEGLYAGSNQKWTVSVAADDVKVSIVNGKASVTVPQDLKGHYAVAVDNVKKSVSITSV